MQPTFNPRWAPPAGGAHDENDEEGRRGGRGGAAAPAGGAPLGNIGNKPAAVDFKRVFHWTTVDRETGEIIPLEQHCGTLQPVRDPKVARLERFGMQAAARKLLPDRRIKNCLRALQKGRAAVEVWQSCEHGSTQYAALQTCCSVWGCPVCAARISERRRLELLQAMEQHKASGGHVLLLTLTNPHAAGDDLPAMLDAQAKAMDRMKGSRSFRALCAVTGLVGMVRAWEVTHGANGWHPHFHVLLFVRSGLDLAELRPRFYDAWANACRLAKLPIPSKEHGVRLDDGSQAASYASKWGLDAEMTKGHIKKAAKGSTPWDLLRTVLYQNDRQASALFRMYYHAFKGRKQLVWSKGLKSRFAIDERTDEEIAAEIEDSARLLGEIELEEWRLVLKFEVRGELLELARHSWSAVRTLIDELVQQNSKIVCTKRQNQLYLNPST